MVDLVDRPRAMAVSLFQVALYLRDISRPFPPAGATTEAPGGRMEAPSAAPAQIQEVPTKSVAYTTKIHLSAAVSFVDFGGRSSPIKKRPPP